MSTLELILEALKEADILEQGRSTYDTDHMLLTAMKLSGAPWSFVVEVFNEEQVYA